MNNSTTNDFSKGSVTGNIMRLAGPMTLAQLINLLYNIIDRMYIGHLPEDSTLALTGLGLTFPILMIVTAFSNLFGMGGAPLFSIARGKQDEKRAADIMGCTFTMLLITGIVLTIIGLIIKKPVLYLFGASDQTFPFADDYLSIYLLGSTFVMFSLGMNTFINAQGFARKGMLTVLIGAVLNIALDPIFIFVFHMGVRGAALATIISQFASALWVIRFLTGKEAIIRLTRSSIKVHKALLGEITSLGTSGFIMSVTNSAVQVVCNASLQTYGGDIYVGVMTVINSIREVVSMPVTGLTSAGQPVLGYNYGAHLYKRVRSGIKFMSISCISYTTVIWILLLIFPRPFIHLFNSNSELLTLGVPSMTIYFFGFFMMSLQFSGQSTFVALGRSKYAVFFSIFRKVIIVVPLTLLLPHIGGLGVNGVFLAEPISNFIGGTASFMTMMFTVWRELKKNE
ncbi:MAG: MATE family efflux transporter [Clostridia bacterium]|nr:MATE family efflux transporter [Clostridia bacterium]NCC42611.1 MATE family efflux transporter [Clostridia bacterium]